MSTKPQQVYLGISEDDWKKWYYYNHRKSFQNNKKYLCAPDLEGIFNKRSEITSRCLHQKKHLLSNYDSKD